jgi:dATP pyrophosphohydrolase
MTDAIVRAVDVYPYRLRLDQPLQFLVLRRAITKAYAGQWRMIGGKIQPGEAAWQAALRETTEETGLSPLRLWCLPSVNTFYEWAHDRINLIPAFAAHLDADPVLNDEHDAFAWLPPDEAAARLAWPEQQRLLRLAASLLTRNAVQPQWDIPRL